MRSIVLILLIPYSLWLIFAYEYHFIDGVNLAFHEAGHLLFTPFGRTMHFLGGTIGQLVFPVGIMIYFFRQDKAFEASIGGVWLAESLMNVAHYMADARDMNLPLVGGGVHDWNYLFAHWGVLYRAEGIAAFFHVTATILLIATLIFMFRQILKDRSRSSQTFLTED